MNRALPLVAISSLLGLAAGLIVTSASAQEAPQKTQSVKDFPDLIAGLKATPGCLGAEPLVAKGGKQFVIFAWFKDKKAVQDWYYSPMHWGAMRQFFPARGAGPEPLSLIKDPKTPVMVIASVTPSDKPVEGQTLAVSQIAIEMYTPLPGGAALGSKFAPEAFPAVGMTRLDKR
jgi:hypothetical protein